MQVLMHAWKPSSFKELIRFCVVVDWVHLAGFLAQRSQTRFRENCTCESSMQWACTCKQKVLTNLCSICTKWQNKHEPQELRMDFDAAKQNVAKSNQRWMTGSYTKCYWVKTKKLRRQRDTNEEAKISFWWDSRRFSERGQGERIWEFCVVDRWQHNRPTSIEGRIGIPLHLVIKIVKWREMNILICIQQFTAKRLKPSSIGWVPAQNQHHKTTQWNNEGTFVSQHHVSYNKGLTSRPSSRGGGSEMAGNCRFKKKMIEPPNTCIGSQPTQSKLF